jgi:hypothetical protein
MEPASRCPFKRKPDHALRLFLPYTPWQRIDLFTRASQLDARHKRPRARIMTRLLAPLLHLLNSGVLGDAS